MRQLNEDQMAELRQLATEYGLKGHHFHKDSRGFVIITRAGVEQIAGKLNARVEYTPIFEWSNPADGTYVIQAKAWYMIGENAIVATSFGEVNAKNNRNAYPVAMAEKRALSRAVLKLAGLYKLNVYGEDEIEQQ